MTKVPFDLDVLMNDYAIVHVPTKEAAVELATMLHDPLWNGENMSEAWRDRREATCYRFRNGVQVNRGNLDCYQWGYEEYAFMIFDGGVNDLPEVGDLI